MKTSDEILVQKILDGDESSFQILVERYKRSVFLHAVKTTRDFHDAEDITQDVFVEAYLNLQKLREPAKFGSWLRANYIIFARKLRPCRACLRVRTGAARTGRRGLKSPLTPLFQRG